MQPCVYGSYSASLGISNLNGQELELQLDVQSKKRKIEAEQALQKKKNKQACKDRQRALKQFFTGLDDKSSMYVFTLLSNTMEPDSNVQGCVNAVFSYYRDAINQAYSILNEQWKVGKRLAGFFKGKIKPKKIDKSKLIKKQHYKIKYLKKSKDELSGLTF